MGGPAMATAEGKGAGERDLLNLMRAVKLQSVFRGHRCRQTLGAKGLLSPAGRPAHLHAPRVAATRVQAAFRGHLDRVRAQQALARKRALVRIQRIQVAVPPPRNAQVSAVARVLCCGAAGGGTQGRAAQRSVCVCVCVFVQATYRGHVTRVRVRRDLGDVLLANRRRRRPRNLLQHVENTLRRGAASPHAPAFVLAFSFALVPAVAASGAGVMT